jgi:fumarate reductase subunit C
MGEKLNMANNPNYTKYHPKWYRKRIPIFWWTHKWVHTKFILRELTSLFVAFYALVLLFQIRALAQGPEVYTNFLDRLKTPVSIALHCIAFLFVLFHSITWFNLAPKALVLRLGKTRIPGKVIAALNYIAWIVFSSAIVWILLAD